MVGVLTYNIHSGIGTDGVYDVERIAGVIRRSKADIVCLQEACLPKQPAPGILPLGFSLDRPRTPSKATCN